jgi:hypothetical protein
MCERTSMRFLSTLYSATRIASQPWQVNVIICQPPCRVWRFIMFTINKLRARGSRFKPQAALPPSVRPFPLNGLIDNQLHGDLAPAMTRSNPWQLQGNYSEIW